MAQILREFIGLNYDKGVIKEAIAKSQPIILSGVLQRADAKNQNNRIYPKHVLEREIANYQKAVHEGRALGECVPAGTEIFTPEGWRKIEDMRIGDEAYTLNTKTNEIQSQPVQDVVNKLYNDDLIRIYNERLSLDMTTTKKHLICLWDRYGKYYTMTAEDLADAIARNDSKVSHSCIRRGGVWKGENPETFTIPGSDITMRTSLWASFLGIYIAEGHTGGTRGGKFTNAVVISQVKPESKAQIRAMLGKMPFQWTEFDRGFRCNNAHLANHLRWLGNSWEKHIPHYAKQWEPNHLNAMMDWMLLGDGKNRHNHKGILIEELATTSARLASDVQDIMLKAGSAASTYIVAQRDRMIEGGRMIYASDCQPLHIVHRHAAKAAYLDGRFTKIERIKHNGSVHCVRMPNKTWLMRQNNVVCWTHNCDHPDDSVVSLKNVSHVVREIGWNGNDVVGKVEILNTPSGKILQSLMESGITLGISSRGVGEVRKDEQGCDVVEDSFTILAFDCVSDPSTHGAFLHESKNIAVEEVVAKLPKTDRINRIANEILNS